MRKLFAWTLCVASMNAGLALADSLPAHEQQRQQATQLYQAGNWDQVITVTSAILEANAEDGIALHLRGSAKIELGIAQGSGKLIRDGITDAREAITVSSNPDFNFYLPYLYGMTNLARMERQEGHAEVAVGIADQLLQQSGLTAEQKANINYQRGLANTAQQQTDAAVKDFQAAIAAQPKHLAAYMAIADAYADAKKDAEALQAYAAAIQAFPEEPLVYNNQGMYFQKTRRYNDALKSFNAAVAKNPTYHIAITNRGFTWLEGGRPAEAERDFNASLKIAPNQPAVVGFRATARLAQGRWKEALADYDQLIKDNPNDAIAHRDAGFARYFGGDFAGALQEFNEVVRLEPAARFINPWRCWTLIRLGRTAEASGLAQSTRTKTEEQRDWIDWVVLFHMGDITADELMNHVDRTDQEIQTAQLCEARYFIAEHQQKDGQAQQAAANYEQALRTNKRELSAWRGASYALRRFQ